MDQSLGRRGRVAREADPNPNGEGEELPLLRRQAGPDTPVRGVTSQPRGGSLVIKAYVLIQTEPGKTGRVVEAVLQVKGVTAAEGVTGPYDVVALAEARNFDELSRRVIGSIQEIEGVLRTLPCTVVRL
jgi:DNA-binding Lrp family transcriptional regulator